MWCVLTFVSPPVESRSVVVYDRTYATKATVTKREDESHDDDGVRTATSSQPIQLSAVEALSDQRSKSTSLVTEVAIPWLLASTPITKATVVAIKSIGSCP